MTLIGDFTGGSINANDVNINTRCTADSLQVSTGSVVSMMRTGRNTSGGSGADGEEFNLSFGVTFPTVPDVVLLTIQEDNDFYWTGVVTAKTTTGFTMYVYKTGAGGSATCTINWLAIT